MAQKKKHKDKKKHRQPSHPKSTKWSSELQTVSVATQSGVFIWKISNFSDVNAQYVFSDYFELCGMRFILELFPKGEATRNTSRKYMGLYLHLDEGDAAVLLVDPSFFVCAQLAVVNHADDSKHASKYIFHRYAYGSNSSGQNEFMSLDFLQDPESEFLLNGTDLHIRIDVRILDDDWSFQARALPQEQQPDEEAGSQFEGAYGGKFTWTIENYSLFQERFKNNGMLCSHSFPIGESQYCIHLESQTTTEDEGSKNFLSMFLDNVTGDEEDKSAWCVLVVKLRNEKLKEPETIAKAYGRLGIDVIDGAKYFRGWLKLMEMSHFENPDNGYIMKNDKVSFVLHFLALKERTNFIQCTEDSKKIWFLGEGTSKPASNPKKKIAERVYSKFSWEIHNFPAIVNLLRKCDMGVVIESRRMRIGQTETRLAIVPLGRPAFADHVGLLLANPVSCERRLPVEVEETNFVAHYRLRIENQIDPSKTKVTHDMERFDKYLAYYGMTKFMSQSDLYSESGGYIVNGKVRMSADVYVLDEKLEISGLVPPTHVRWKVDNFLAWRNINMRGLKNSPFFEVEGCRLCFGTRVDEDWNVSISLKSDMGMEIDGLYFELDFRIGVLNQKNSWRSVWMNNIRSSTDQEIQFYVGDVPTLVKRDGFVVKDKLVFACEIFRCVPYS